MLQNPTLMAFYMRLYICGVKVLLEGMCVWFPACFHHIAPAVKASLPEAYLIEKAAPFTVRSALNFTRATAVRPSCSSQQKYHVCLSLERIYSADSLAGTPATAEGIRFSLYLFSSFFLLWKSSLLCDTTGKLPSSSPWSPVK